MTPDDRIRREVQQALGVYGHSDEARPAVVKLAKANVLRLGIWKGGEHALWTHLEGVWDDVVKAKGAN